MLIGNKTILCIHRDPSELRIQQRFLRKNGYEVVIACGGLDGLRVLTAGGVDATILRSCPNLLESLLLAVALKQVRPQVPIVLLSEDVELPEGALQTVDALVTKTDEPQVLLSTLESQLRAQLSPVASGKDETSPKDKSGRERRRVLEDLGALVDAFTPRVRERVLAEIRSVFAALAQQIHQSVQRPLEQAQARPDPAPGAAP